MTSTRFYLTLLTAAALTTVTVQTAHAQDKSWQYTSPDSLAVIHTMDSLMTLDGVDLYATTAIWVDTATQYDDMEFSELTWDATNAMLRGIPLTKAQLAARERIFNQQLYGMGKVTEKRMALQGKEAVPGAWQRRGKRFYYLVQRWSIAHIRAFLTPEQRVTFDARVKEHDAA